MKLAYLTARLRTLIPMAAAATVFSGCVSFEMKQPKDGAAVKSPANVTIEASPRMSHLVVRVDGNDVTSQINDVSDSESEGDINLLPGTHTITAEADVDCWYCANKTYEATATHTFCIPSPNSVTFMTKIAISESSQRSWKLTSDPSIGVAADDGSLDFRWNFVRLPGAGTGSNVGLIQSTENNCLCMRSTGDKPDIPIGLALCDTSDPTQQWEAFSLGFGVYRFRNWGRTIDDACLTEGPNNVLIQRPDKGASDQHWRVREHSTGQTGGSPF